MSVDNGQSLSVSGQDLTRNGSSSSSSSCSNIRAPWEDGKEVLKPSTPTRKPKPVSILTFQHSIHLQALLCELHLVSLISFYKLFLSSTWVVDSKEDTHSTNKLKFNLVNLIRTYLLVKSCTLHTHVHSWGQLISLWPRMTSYDEWQMREDRHTDLSTLSECSPGKKCKKVISRLASKCCMIWSTQIMQHLLAVNTTAFSARKRCSWGETRESFIV